VPHIYTLKTVRVRQTVICYALRTLKLARSMYRSVIIAIYNKGETIEEGN